MTNPDIISMIHKLSIREKLEIVEDIWDSISEASTDLPVTDYQKKDLDERINDSSLSDESWDTVKKRIKSNL